MDDFVEATRVTPLSENSWTAEIRKDWSLWGPSGGYLSAVAMRAAGEASSFEHPLSFACQFLNRAEFAPVEVYATRLKTGKRSEALRIEIFQNDKLILNSHVWTGVKDAPGMKHDFTFVDDLPDPERLPTYSEVYPEEPVYPFLNRLGHRPIDPVPRSAKAQISRPELSGFFRLQPRSRHHNAFVDTTRVFLLIDTYAWLATYPAHPSDGPSPWIAPNLDFYYRFHHPSMESEWLHLNCKADLAAGGLIGAEGEIRSADGKLIARGASQLICYPRPR